MLGPWERPRLRRRGRRTKGQELDATLERMAATPAIGPATAHTPARGVLERSLSWFVVVTTHGVNGPLPTVPCQDRYTQSGRRETAPAPAPATPTPPPPRHPSTPPRPPKPPANPAPSPRHTARTPPERMLATALSATLVGLQAHPVRVEVAGRARPALLRARRPRRGRRPREPRPRASSALAQLGVHIGECGIVVNLAPADVKKTGSGFDLAIAAAVARRARAGARARRLEGVLFVGELSLEGTVQPLRGVLAAAAGRAGSRVRRAVVPRANAAEAALVDGVEVRTVGFAGRAGQRPARRC